MITPHEAMTSRGGDAAPDVAVVGGGIVGLATAAHLAEAGASVVLYEGEALGAGASGRNSGIVQHPFDAALVPLYEESVALYRALGARGISGLTLSSEPAGMLLVSHDEAPVVRIAGDLRRQFPALAPETLEGAALRALEPGLADDVAACRIPIGFPVPPGAPTYAYATWAEQLGVRIRLGHPVGIAIEGGRAVGITLDGGVRRAGAVVVAAGPWTPEIIDPSGHWRPIRRLWGVVVEVLLAGAPGHVLEEAEIDEALGAGVPGRDGRADEGAPTTDAGDGPAPEFSLVTAAGVSSVGSTFLETEPDPPAWEVPILTRAAGFVPAIADAPIRGVRACARPASVDGRPLLGRVPGIDGLYVVAGHGPWGISTGPASGRLVADLVAGRTVTIPPELDAARFGCPLDGGSR
jgi:glycine oxidase